MIIILELRQNRVKMDPLTSKGYGDFAKSLEDELMNYTEETNENPSDSGGRGPDEAEHSL